VLRTTVHHCPPASLTSADSGPRTPVNSRGRRWMRPKLSPGRGAEPGSSWAPRAPTRITSTATSAGSWSSRTVSGWQIAAPRWSRRICTACSITSSWRAGRQIRLVLYQRHSVAVRP